MVLNFCQHSACGAAALGFNAWIVEKLFTTMPGDPAMVHVQKQGFYVERGVEIMDPEHAALVALSNQPKGDCTIPKITVLSLVLCARWRRHQAGVDHHRIENEKSAANGEVNGVFDGTTNLQKNWLELILDLLHYKCCSDVYGVKEGTY
jgi:hypothetical protein